MWKDRAAKANFKDIPANEIYTPAFMRKYTVYTSFEEFLRISGFTMETELPNPEFDDYVSKTTKFDSWSDMQLKAAEIYAIKKLGF